MKKYNGKSTKELGTKVLTDNAPFAIREAFNQLRTNLMYTMSGDCNGAPVYGITSTSENAGKSTVIVNLAISFAQLDKKVLLIDGDMRCPVIHKHFSIDAHNVGLSELISGISKDVIVKDIRPNLDIITSGRIPPNPSELITSPRFAQYIEEWKQSYDIIFIDFPPVGVVTDSIANHTNITGYIFTIRAGQCNAKEITASIETIEQVGAKIVGIVLNDHNIKGSDRYKHNPSRYNKKQISRYEIAAKNQTNENL